MKLLSPPIRNILRNNILVRFLYFDCHFADIPVLFNLGSFNNQSSSAIKEFLCKGELADKKKVEEIKIDIKR